MKTTSFQDSYYSKKKKELRTNSLISFFLSGAERAVACYTIIIQFFILRIFSKNNL